MADTLCDCGFCDRCLQQWHEEARNAIQENAELRSRVRELEAQLKMTNDAVQWSQNKRQESTDRIAELEAINADLNEILNRRDSTEAGHVVKLSSAYERIKALESELKKTWPMDREQLAEWSFSEGLEGLIGEESSPKSYFDILPTPEAGEVN